MRTMISRVAIPLLLLPLLAVTLPLMFALAWMHEAISDMAARPRWVSANQGQVGERVGLPQRPWQTIRDIVSKCSKDG
jgi:hypothetical protein